MNWQELFLTADGRITREKFWIGWAIVFVANLVLGILPLIHILVHLATIWIMVCLYSKRLHDMGRTAWLQLIPFGAGVLAFIVGMMLFGWAVIAGAAWGGFGAHGPGATAAMLGSVGVFFLVLSVCGLINLVFLIWVGATQGQSGPNMYGPDPRQASQEELFQ